MTRTMLFRGRTVSTLLALLIVSQVPAAQPMNVVFILIDDLGWSDLGCYGSDFYDTPNVDAFAQHNLKFTQAYAAAPVCSPTRAAIMTGKYPARLDMTIWHEGAIGGGPNNRKLRDAPAQPNLPHAETTLAEIFQSAGYLTAHVGKWHLGTAAYYPETHGYDLNIGGTFWGAPATFFFPFAGPWSKTNPEFRYVPGLAPGVEGDYLPDRLTDRAIGIINSQKDETFFLSLWYHTVHSPIEAPTAIVEKYRQRKPGKRHREPTYAAMVERMDHNVGRVLQRLKELNLEDRTIVIFTSDNGGVDFDQRSIVPTSNRPLRSGKGTLYEGGLRVPLVIRWPGLTAANVSDEMVSSEDFYPTLVEYLHSGVSKEHADGALTREPLAPKSTVDGMSLLPILGDPTKRLKRDCLYWHFPHYYPRMTPGSAIRCNQWKLIHYYEDDRVELYNLNSDLGEQTDLAASEVNVAGQLRRKLDAWRTRVDANPPAIAP